MEYTRDLGSRVERHAGSTPVRGTMNHYVVLVLADSSHYWRASSQFNPITVKSDQPDFESFVKQIQRRCNSKPNMYYANRNNRYRIVTYLNDSVDQVLFDGKLSELFESHKPIKIMI